MLTAMCYCMCYAQVLMAICLIHAIVLCEHKSSKSNTCKNDWFLIYQSVTAGVGQRNGDMARYSPPCSLKTKVCFHKFTSWEHDS